MLLTIGIPTFNRVQGVTEHIKGLIGASVPEEAEILVIDNASTDGTFETLKEICDGTPVRVLRNDRNLGFRGNFLRLFQECQTEYLLVTSDEDPVIAPNLGALIGFLLANKPLFVSPQYYRRERPAKLYRGRGKARRITAEEFRSCSSHMPGLVYKTQESSEVVSDMKAHLEKEELAAYPQVILAAGLILRGACFWWDQPIVHQQYVFPKLHGNFNYVPQRWEQFKALVAFFEDRLERAGDPATKVKATLMLRAQQETLFGQLRTAIAQERPDLLPAFDRGARAFYGVKHPLRSVAGKCLFAVRHPVASGRAFFRKIRGAKRS